MNLELLETVRAIGIKWYGKGCGEGATSCKWDIP